MEVVFPENKYFFKDQGNLDVWIEKPKKKE
jgi:hypothetical protein